MRILVTGGAGFIGSHTADLLLSAGYRVRVLDSLAPPVHVDGRLPDYFPSEAEFIHGDVRDKEIWRTALAGVDGVFHLAAYQDYLPDFSKFFHVNAVGTALLYEVIVEEQLPVQKIVVASSQATYGEGKYACETDGVQYPDPRPSVQLDRQDWEPHCPLCDRAMQWSPTDESRVNPHNSYAMSKYTEETIALVLGRRYEIPSVAMRYSIVQGARQSFRNAYSGVLRIFAMQVLAGQRPTAYEDGEQVRDYVYVGDVALANLLVLEDARADYRSFNVGGGRAVTVNEFARIMAAAAGRPDLTPVSRGEYRFGDTRHILSDISALSALGWEPHGSVEQSVHEYLAWAQAQPDFGDYATKARETMQSVGALRGGG
ncbi:MAG: NAD-dependent epimerase/dehydratase family protein [Anaerolineales bacterium]